MEKQAAKQMFEPIFEQMRPIRELKKFAEYAFDHLPDYWFEKPASSTGKYHPKFSNGDGGLVRHTLYACLIFEQLCRAYDKQLTDEVGPMYKAKGLCAVVFHDAIKYGIVPGEFTTKTHDVDSAVWFDTMYTQYCDDCGTSEWNLIETHIEDICGAIEHHNGPWSSAGAPTGYFQNLVFLADYFASMKCFEREVLNYAT